MLDLDDRPPADPAVAATLRGHLGVLRRRWRIVLVIALAAPLVAALLALRQPEQHEATAEVLVSREDIARSLTGTQDPGAGSDPQREILNQARIAESAAVSVMATRRAGSALSPTRFLDRTEVEAAEATDVLLFRATGGTPEEAIGLVNGWGRAYVDHATSLNVDALARAERSLVGRLRDVRATDGPGQAAQDLRDELNQVRTLISLQTPQATLIRPAAEAAQVAPRPVRAAALAAVLGLGIAVLLAFVLDAIDTRVRDAEDAAELLRLPLIGQLPPPRRRRGAHAPVVMLDGPAAGGRDDRAREAFRLLRSGFEAATVRVAPRTVLVTSGRPVDGGASTLANLAIAQARAGSVVGLVDLDLRRPELHELLGVPRDPGVSDVLLDRADLGVALRRVDLDVDPDAAGLHGLADDPQLLVLPAGTPVADPGGLLTGAALGELLDAVAARCDVVLVSAAPLLVVSDAVTVSRHVGGVVVVVRLDSTSRTGLRRLRQLLDRAAARPLGVVTTADPAAADAVPYGAERRPRPRSALRA